jgi:hypothetical protein
VIGIAFQQVPVDAIQGLFGDLGSTGVVKEYRRTVQRRELAANNRQIKGHVMASGEKKVQATGLESIAWKSLVLYEAAAAQSEPERVLAPGVQLGVPKKRAVIVSPCR